jgi:hypothetical protein
VTPSVRQQAITGLPPSSGVGLLIVSQNLKTNIVDPSFEPCNQSLPAYRSSSDAALAKNAWGSLPLDRADL